MLPRARNIAIAAVLMSAVPSASLGQTWVFGGPDDLRGKFQDPTGEFDDQGWLSVDCTPDDHYWQVDTFRADNLNGHGTGNHALWCGQSAAQQPSWVNAPGYGNGWMAAAEWRGVVPDPGVAVTVGLEFYYNYDTEPAYDFFMVDWHDGTHWQNLLNVSGTNKSAGSFEPPGEHFVQSWAVQPSQLTGSNQDQVRIRLFVRSDGGVSDQDGYLGFDFDGAVQVDDIVVSFDGVPVDGGGDGDAVATFEAGDDEGWMPVGSPCTCAVLSMLPEQYDPAMSNPTPVLGRVLDTSVRVAGRCFFTSPEFDWTVPQLFDGAFLEFDAFFYSTGRLGFTSYQAVMAWRVGGAWQPEETVFVGEVPAMGWRRVHVDLTGIAPPNAELAAMAFRTGFGDGLLEVFALDNVTLARFDTAVAAPVSRAGTALLGVHPNPANPRATVKFWLERSDRVKLTVYDVRGRKVKTLVDAAIEAGRHGEIFDGRDDNGQTVASGLYLVRLETRSKAFAQRFTLVK